jgi:hypothetical protein
VKQVFRRLRKYGWLRSRTEGDWIPTLALRHCRDPRALSRHLPSRVRRKEPPEPPPVEDWGAFVEQWVFRHRDTPFGIGEVSAAMVQRGFGAGRTEDRLNEARGVAEEVLDLLASEYLVEQEAGQWQATEILRDWPSA